MHVEPLSFEEFLLAQGKSQLVEYLAQYEWNMNIPGAIHEQLLSIFKEFTIVGGMPAAVSLWSRNRSLQEVEQIHLDLLATYRDDFSKYSGRIKTDRLNEVTQAVPQLLGQKFVFKKVNPELQAATVRRVVELLTLARVAHRVNSCAANGVPLTAELRTKYFKMILLDTGLACSSLGLSLSQPQGGVAEQVTGQLLRTLTPYYVEPALFYWQREEKGSNAEVDYVIQHGTQVIPIEVKAGTTGTLKSLHLFMGLKKLGTAVRVNTDFPSRTPVRTQDSFGSAVAYELLSLPFYLLGQLHRLVLSS